MWILLFDLGRRKLWGQCHRGQGEATDDPRNDKTVYIWVEPEIELRLIFSIFFIPAPNSLSSPAPLSLSGQSVAAPLATTTSSLLAAPPRSFL